MPHPLFTRFNSIYLLVTVLVTSWAVIQLWITHLPVSTQMNIYMNFGMQPARLTDGDQTLLRFGSIISYQFLHESWSHMLWNACQLIAAAFAISPVMRIRSFTLIYMLGAVTAAIAYALFGGEEGVLVGASGCILALTGATGVAFIQRRPCIKQPRLFWPLMIMAVCGLTFIASDILVYGIYGASGNSPLPAHAGGYVSGVLLYMLFGIILGKTEDKKQHDRK